MYKGRDGSREISHGLAQLPVWVQIQMQGFPDLQKLNNVFAIFSKIKTPNVEMFEKRYKFSKRPTLV